MFSVTNHPHVLNKQYVVICNGLNFSTAFLLQVCTAITHTTLAFARPCFGPDSSILCGRRLILAANTSNYRNGYHRASRRADDFTAQHTTTNSSFSLVFHGNKEWLHLQSFQELSHIKMITTRQIRFPGVSPTHIAS